MMILEPGHTLQRAIGPARLPGHDLVALECTCGLVFARDVVSGIDQMAKARVFESGMEKGLAHLQAAARALETLRNPAMGKSGPPSPVSSPPGEDATAGGQPSSLNPT